MSGQKGLPLTVLRWVLALGLTGVAGLLLFAWLFLGVVVFPDGNWLVARTAEQRAPNGFRFRTFVVGPDGIVRVELDTDGDGSFDVRGDDWGRAAPVWCRERVDGAWVSVAPERCQAAWEAMQSGQGTR